VLLINKVGKYNFIGKNNEISQSVTEGTNYASPGHSEKNGDKDRGYAVTGGKRPAGGA
jgi:hypothetical protein